MRSWSPALCPRPSLTTLKRSRSRNSTATSASSRSARRGRAPHVREVASGWQSGQLVVQRLVRESLLESVALRCVTDDGGVGDPLAELHRADRHLGVEARRVVARGLALPCALSGPAPALTQRRRGGEVGEKQRGGLADHLRGVVTEDQLGGPVEALDAAAVIDGDGFLRPRFRRSRACGRGWPVVGRRRVAVR